MVGRSGLAKYDPRFSPTSPATPWTPDLAWLIKLPLIRYGGLPMYRRLLPLFFGLIVGDCVVGCAWTIIGLAGDLPSYRFFP